jgi:hypothetical protein
LLGAFENMLIPFIEEYDWKNLEQAYGSADHAPKYLNDLISSDEYLRSEAIYGFLHSEACHQYTTYSCTAPVVRCVVFILENNNFNDFSELRDILGFIRACTYSAKSKEDLKKEIVNGLRCYEKYSNHSDINICKESKGLIEFCFNNGA